MQYLIKRNNVYSLKRRVPKQYSSVETRAIVWISLHTDSETTAQYKAVQVWRDLTLGWEARLAGKTDDAEAYHKSVIALAESKGFTYLPIKKVETLPIDGILDRIEAISTSQGEPNLDDAAGLLGNAGDSQFILSKALEIYWGLSQDKTLQKSPDQLRRWRAPRLKAIGNLIACIGDKPLNEISRDDMLAFRQWWIERVADEGLTANSANKDLTHIGSVLKMVNDLKRLGLDLPTHGLKIKAGDADTRPAFSTPWIKNRLLAPNVLNGLNLEARAIFLTMVNTGARPSEIANLLPEDIMLEHAFPHISITPHGRELKSRNARRKLPLLGCSLSARACAHAREGAIRA